MGIVQSVSVLALQQLVDGACRACCVDPLAGQIATETTAKVTKYLARRFADHFKDHSRGLPKALLNANKEAWNALKIALAGDSWWQWIKTRIFVRGETQGFRVLVQEYLSTIPLPMNKEEFCKLCLNELRAAEAAGVLTGRLDPEQLAGLAGEFARYGEPEKILQAEWGTVDRVAAALEPKYPNLSELVRMRPTGGHSLLVKAVRYYFQREVVRDAELYRLVSLASWEKLEEGQKEGFDALADLMVSNGKVVDQVLAELLETGGYVRATHEKLVNVENVVISVKDLLERAIAHGGQTPIDQGGICLDWQELLSAAACATGMATDGEIAVTLHENKTVHIWSMDNLSRHLIITPRGPDTGYLVACAIRRTKAGWDLWLGLRNAVEIWRISDELKAEYGAVIECEDLVDVHASDGFFGVATSAGRLELREPSGEVVDRFECNQAVTSGSFCDNGRYFIVGTKEGKIIELDRNLGRMEGNDDHQGKRVSAVSGLEKKPLYVSAGEDGSVVLRKAGVGRIGEPKLFGVAVTCAVWDRRGSLIFVGLKDKALIAKDILTGGDRWRRVLADVPSAIISINERLLAVASYGGTVELCNALTGQAVATLAGFGGDGWLAISSDEQLLGFGYDRFVVREERKHKVARDGFSVSNDKRQ